MISLDCEYYWILSESSPWALSLHCLFMFIPSVCLPFLVWELQTPACSGPSSNLGSWRGASRGDFRISSCFMRWPGQRWTNNHVNLAASAACCAGTLGSPSIPRKGGQFFSKQVCRRNQSLRCSSNCWRCAMGGPVLYMPPVKSNHVTTPKE